jgi:hypothetical protein
VSEQEIRAQALGIAVLMLGPIPKINEVDEDLDPHKDSANLSDSKAYENYLWLAKRIERYVKDGGSLP